MAVRRHQCEEANRALIEWLREHNAGRTPADRVSLHGFDLPTENTMAPSPRRYLEPVRDFLGADFELAAGPDADWETDAAVLDPASSPGRSERATRLREVAGDLGLALHEQAPDLIERHGLVEWRRARARLQAASALLSYHRVCAEQITDLGARMQRLLATRDALMAQNLLDILREETDRGPTVVFAHNLHLTRTPSEWDIPGREAKWYGAGSILASLLGDAYAFVTGSIGPSQALNLPAPEAGSYEASLQTGEPMSLHPAQAATGVRRDVQSHSYFPLDASMLAGADYVMHISDPEALTAKESA